MHSLEARTSKASMNPGRHAHRILIVEDEEGYREAITRSLERDGFVVESAVDGREALTKFRATDPDLILLDVMLPHMSGIDVCREIRKVSDVPIIFLSARSTEIDVVIGLEVGGDDYIAKPFRVRELLARVRTALRRRRVMPLAPVTSQEIYAYDDLCLDLGCHEVTLRGTPIPLPRKEFQVLSLLVRNAGRAISRDDLIAQVWGRDYFGDTKTLDVHIKRIRRKLEDDPEQARRIVTVRGFGYKFDPTNPTNPTNPVAS
jgi:two-component system, OmpR family, response regulator RegX3